MTGATVSRHRGRHHGHCPLEGFVSAAAGTPRQPSGHAGTDDDRRQRRRERQRVLASAAHAGRGAAARRGHRAAGGERPLTRQGRQSRCLGTAVERWLVGGTRRFVGQMRPPPSWLGSVRSEVTDRLGDGIRAAANPSLRRGQLGDQRAPAREQEPPLLGKGHRVHDVSADQGLPRRALGSPTLGSPRSDLAPLARRSVRPPKHAIRRRIDYPCPTASG